MLRRAHVALGWRWFELAFLRAGLAGVALG